MIFATSSLVPTSKHPSDQEMAVLVESSSDAIVGFDLDRRVTAWNPGAERLYGYTATEMIGASTSLTIPPELENEARLMRERVMQGDQVTRYETTRLRKDGSRIMISLSLSAIRGEEGRIVGLVSTAHDITSRVRAEEALRDSQRRLADIVDFLPDATVAIDKDGHVIIWNKAIERMSGIPAAQMIGKGDHLYSVPFYGEAQMQLADFALRSYEEIPPRYSNITREGDTLSAEVFCKALYDNRGAWVFSKVSPLRDQSGTIVGAIESIRDITDRKLATEGLVESEKKFHLLFEQSSDGNCILDNGRFTECNEAAIRIAGLTAKEQLIGLRPVDISTEYQLDGQLSATKAERMIALAYEKGSHCFEWTRRRHDGSEIALEILLTAIPIKGRWLLHVNWRDISTRKHAEKALRESEQRYRLLVENSKDGIFVAQDGMIKYANPAVVEIVGRSEQEISRTHFLELIHPDDRAMVWECHVKRLKGEDIQSRYAFRIIGGSGDTKWVELSAVLIQFEGRPATLDIVTDITGRRQAEEVLRESEQRLSDIVDFLPDATFVIDTKGTIAAWNRAMEQMTGKTKQQMLGCGNYEYAIPFYGRRRPILIDFSFDNQEQIKENYEFIERNGTTFVAETFAPMIHEGKGAYLWGAATLLRDQRGKICGAIESIRDITDRRQTEEEKAGLERQLQQAQKMESVGRLAGGVAHDFNNMLSVILGHTELALEQVDQSQPLRDDLEEIRKAAERSASLTRQLLGFARKQTVAPRVLDVNHTVEGMLTMLKRMIGEDVHLTWQPKTDLWPVKVDPSQIDQLLTNLCVNARDAIADLGTITIETANSVIDEAYCADNVGFVPGEYVLLAITDNGSGMDRETQSHLFEPFFTTKEMGKGTGLGLATVYGIIKQNNGFINVYSELGHGTRFTIYLPRYAGKIEQARGRDCEGAALRGQETILLVEDEPASLELIRKMLEGQGYTVLAAGGPSEAIRLAREHAGEIHLLLTDVVMPEMNGHDLARNLLALFPRLKRLFASGYTANAIAHQGVLDEGVHFIQKPFSRRDLAAKVREALDGE